MSPLRKFRRTVTLISGLIIVLLTNFIYAQKEKSHFQKPHVTEIEYGLFELLNKEREKRGLHPLIFSKNLTSLARKHSQDMADHDNLSHLSSSDAPYTERLVEGSFFFIKNGENVAFSETFKAEFIHQKLMESAGHRENILDPDFDRIGVGVTFKENQGYYITQDFLQSLEPKEGKKVKEDIQEKINTLRVKNSLLPLRFLEKADKYAQKCSLSRVDARPPPAPPSHFGETHNLYIAHPSLEKAYSVYKDEILDKIYESAGLGINFSRNKKYPGGAYFITLILFPENEYKSWSNEDLKEIAFHAVNEIRRKRSKSNGKNNTKKFFNDLWPKLSINVTQKEEKNPSDHSE